MRIFAQRLMRWLRTILAAVIIGAAVLSLLMRLALTQVDQFRQPIAETLSHVLGAQLSMGQVDARLRGFAPQLTLRNVRLRDPDSGESLLALRELRIDLDLSASLREGAPRIDGVTLVGADLEVLRQSDASIQVRGLDALDGDDPGARTFFFRRGRFSLSDSRLRWIDRRTDAPPISLHVQRLDLHNRSQRHLLKIAARPAGETVGDLTLLADLYGSAYRMGEWSGELYLRWQGHDLAALLHGRLPAGLDIASRRIDIESWNRIEFGALTSALARVELSGLSLHPSPGLGLHPKLNRQRSVQIGDLGLLADWQPTDRGWQLRLAKLVIARFELPWATVNLDRLPLAVGGSDDQPRRRLSGAIGELPLALLPRLAPIVAMASGQPESGIQTLRGFELGGQVRDVHYRLALDARPKSQEYALVDWQLQGGIDGLRIDQCSSSSSAASAPASALTSSPTSTATSLSTVSQDVLPATPATHTARIWNPDAATLAGKRAPPANSTGAHACFTQRTRLSGLDLIFDVGPGGGYVGLHGQSTRLDPTPVLGGDLDLNVLAGDIHWRLDAENGLVDLWTDALRASTPEISTETDLQAQLYTFGASPVIKLHTRMENGRPGNLDQLGTYLPVSIIDANLQRWLLRAIPAGTLTSGETRFHGRLRDFPNDCGNKHFELTLNVRGGELDYWPPRPAPHSNPSDQREQAQRLGWPPLREIDGSLRFRDRSLIIDLSHGELRNTRLTSGNARIENLWRPISLDLQGQAIGPMTDGLWVMKNTPLAFNLARVADAFDTTGDAGLELALQIPLQPPVDKSKPRPVGFQGALQFDGTPSVTPRALPLSAIGLKGRLTFDAAGVRAEGIDASIDQQRVQIGLHTESSDRTHGKTRIDIAGRSKVRDLSDRYPSPLWSIAEGHADWTLELSLNNADLHLPSPPLRLSMQSDLRGLALSPPAPLGKNAAESRTLDAMTTLTGVWPISVRLHYGEHGALLQLQRQPGTQLPELERVAVAIGADPTALPDSPGIRIDGQIDTLDLSSWIDWSRQHRTWLDSGNNDRLPVLPSRLRVAKVQFGALQLTDLDVDFSPSADNWLIDFNGAGNGGSVTLPRAGSDGILRVHLQDLDLQPFAEPDPESSQANPGTDPREIGQLELNVESLRFGKDLLGQASLSVEPTADGVRFTGFGLQGPLLNVIGDGRWSIDATDYISTEIRASAEIEDFGRFLHALDYYSEIQAAPARAQLALTWPGGPGDFSLQQARGSLSMDLGAGRLLAVDPGVGRMLGLVNLSALTRRVELDFTDVLDPGFGFDSLSGSVRIGAGQARINRLELLSSTADIRISGVTDLVDQTLDQTVQVTPKVGSGVAIAGAVAGGPLVGAAVLLADKLSGGAMDRIGRQDYRVTGPWAQPNIERLSGFASDADAPDSTPAASGTRSRLKPSTPSSAAGEPSRTQGRQEAADPVEPIIDNPFLEGF
jgi:uncharacterized protein (TIGR02099 family)